MREATRQRLLRAESAIRFVPILALSPEKRRVAIEALPWGPAQYADQGMWKLFHVRDMMVYAEARRKGDR